MQLVDDPAFVKLLEDGANITLHAQLPGLSQHLDLLIPVLSEANGDHLVAHIPGVELRAATLFLWGLIIHELFALQERVVIVS